MKYLLVYNPVSGRARFKKKLKYIRRFFEDRNLVLDCYESLAPRDLEVKIQTLVEGYDVLLIAGGDGTVNEVINGLMRTTFRPAIGILPYGTANDIAGILKISRQVKKALNMFITEEPILMDVNQINDRYFIYTVASGVLTRISYDISRRKLKQYGYLAYVFEGAKDLLKDYKFNTEITANGTKISGEYMLILGLCSTRVGGFRLSNFSKPKLNDGLFELMLFKRVQHFRVLKLLSFFLKRGRKLKEDVQVIASSFKIDTEDHVLWNADGELSTKGSIELKVHKEQLNVFAHKKIKKKFF